MKRSKTERYAIRKEQGSMLILTVLVVAVLTQASAALISKTVAEARLSRNQQMRTELFYLSEGAMEAAIAQFRSDIADFQVDMLTPRYPVSGTLQTSFSPTPTFPQGASADSVFAEVESGERTYNDPDGVKIRVKNYMLTTTLIHPIDNTMQITLCQIVSRKLMYTFQHAVFYDQDLELLPGPDMTFSGRIHCNNDIYLGANSTLTVDAEYLKTPGNIYNRRKDDGSVPGGDVSIKKKGANTYYDMDGFDSDSANWVTGSQTRWNGTVQTGEHGVSSLAAPHVGSIQPGQYYDSQTAYKVINGNLEINGFNMVEGVDIPPGTITTSTTMYNHRESKYIRMTDIDLQKMAGWIDTDADGIADTQAYPNHLPANGMLYATRDDVTATQQPGIRLYNGKEIHRNGGLTVVSNDPIYIQGDFNSVAKKPCAVIGDAVNILSNNWNDANSAAGQNSRLAVDTTVNCSFIAGVDITSSGDYNGGLENFPRLHEKWSNRTLTIRGSFVAIWNSVITQGTWNDSSYSPPRRNWDYDTDYQSGILPPMTPSAVEIVKGAWWQS